MEQTNKQTFKDQMAFHIFLDNITDLKVVLSRCFSSQENELFTSSC